MEEENEKNVNQEKNGRDEIFSRTVRAGKRTYFFDVKATRKNEYYLTITESKKHFGKEGKPFYEKHKVFLYKEDFEGFMKGLDEVIEYVYKEQPEQLEEEEEKKEMHEVPASMEEESVAEDFTNIEFEDLGDKQE